MNKEKTIIVQQTAKHFPKLNMKDRILLYLIYLDLEAGRDGDVSDWFGDLKEGIFMFSSTFIHSAEFTFFNILYWEELKEYGHPDKWGDGGIKLPPNHVGIAAIQTGKQRSFRIALKKLIEEKCIYAFVPSMRAVKGLGGKSVPLLQIWSEQNRDRFSEIVAISLNERGFKRAKELSEQYSIMMPWQVHKHMVKDRKFAESLTGRDRNKRNNK